MENLQSLVLVVVVVDVQAVCVAAAEHRVPKQREREVLRRGVSVGFGVGQHLLRLLGLQHLVPAAFVTADGGRANLLVEVLRCPVDGFEPADEDP